MEKKKNKPHKTNQPTTKKPHTNFQRNKMLKSVFTSKYVEWKYYAEIQHTWMWLFKSNTGYKTVKEADAALKCM